MILMANTKDRFDRRVSVQAKNECRAALKRLVAVLAGRRGLLYDGHEIDMQGLLNASWLWMESLPVEEVEAALRPHLTRLQVMLDGKPDPGYTETIEPAKPVGISKSKPNRADARPADIDRPARISRKS